MTYTNNQYIKLDKRLEEILKIQVKTDENNRLIEDLEIDDYPNVIIACGNKVEYNNIFGGVKILITNEDALEKNEYKIPEYIERIIVYGYMYRNNKEEIERMINELVNGNELLKAIDRKNENKAIEILEEIQEININYEDKINKWTPLLLASENNMENESLQPPS